MATHTLRNLLAGLALIALGTSSTLYSADTQIEKGKASWYGKELAGRKTASGEIFDPSALTAAHRTHAFGTMLKVTRDSSGQSVIVRVNDRGPVKQERIIDLSQAAAQQLGLIVDGVADVTVEVIAAPQPATPPTAVTTPAKTQSTTTPSNASYRLQLGAFEARERAEALRDALKAEHPDVTVSQANISGKDFFRVRVGSYNTMDEALADLKKIMNAGYTEVAVVRTSQEEAFIAVEKSE